MKTTAIYTRVSTSDQTCEHQRSELRDYCERRGWPAPIEYSDTISGGKCDRPGLGELMQAVRSGKVDRVVCVKLDRFGRSLQHFAMLVGELDKHRVTLICTSQGIDTDHENPAGRLQMHVLAAVAEFERSLISERTKAGLVTARARGKTLGRPAVVGGPALESWRAKKRMAAAIGSRAPTLRELAQALGCSMGMAHKLAHAGEKKELTGETGGV